MCHFIGNNNNKCIKQIIVLKILSCCNWLNIINLGYLYHKKLLRAINILLHLHWYKNYYYLNQEL